MSISTSSLEETFANIYEGIPAEDEEKVNGKGKAEVIGGRIIKHSQKSTNEIKVKFKFMSRRSPGQSEKERFLDKWNGPTALQSSLHIAESGGTPARILRTSLPYVARSCQE